MPPEKFRNFGPDGVTNCSSAAPSAMECRGNCGLLVPVEFAFGGYHMHCGGPEDAECGTTGEGR